MMTIDEMKRLKQQYGYSYEKISKDSGVPLGTVHKIFSGRTKSPRYNTLLALETAFKPAKADNFNKNTQQPSGSEDLYHKYLSQNAAASPALSESPAAYQHGTSPEKVYDRQGTYTIQDYLALPDDQRVELIDGVFYDMAAPYPVHQDICFMLGHYFQNYIEEKGGPCRVLPSPIDVQLDKDDKTVVQPDLCIVCRPELIDGPRIYGAPDLLIEILSKSTRKKDLTLKAGKYCNAGVREYWTVDPEKLKITVFDYEHDGDVAIYGFHNKVPVGIYDRDLVIDFEKIFQRIQGMYGVGKEA